MNVTTEKWLCIGCKSLLGFVEDKKIVRIKRKDLYVEVEGGKVTETCPRCGKRNTITDESFKEVLGGPT
jgi:hypothetical protein